jgi:hypothetical protein
MRSFISIRITEASDGFLLARLRWPLAVVSIYAFAIQEIINNDGPANPMHTYRVWGRGF